MKKNVLALSIATMIGGLGFTGAAFAAAGDVSVNPNGDGHILLVPYYTVQDGNVTAFNIVNTDTKNGKAVKVRFRGASNSDDVLDFQVSCPLVTSGLLLLRPMPMAWPNW